MRDNDSGGEDNKGRKNKLLFAAVWLVYQFISELEKQISNSKFESPQDRASRRTANATIAIAFFAAATFVVSFVTYFVLHGQLSAMQDDQRAWVAPIQMIEDNGPDGKFAGNIAIEMVNPGKTPAIQIHWSDLNIILVSHVPEANEATDIVLAANHMCDGLLPSGGLVLWPNTGHHFWIPLSLTEKPKGKESVAIAISHEKSLIVQGCIAYETNRTRHTSAFQFLWRDTLASPPEQWRFNPTTYGNDAD